MRRLIGGLITLAGLALLGIGGYSAFDTVEVLTRAEPARAVVVDPETVPPKAQDLLAVLGPPVVAIEGHAGGTIYAHLEHGPQTPPAIGESVPVLFDQFSTSRVWLDSFYALFGVTAILAGLGLVALVIGRAVGRSRPAPVLVAGRPVPRPRSSSGRISIIRDRPTSTVTRGGERGMSAVAILALLLLILGVAIWVGFTVMRTPGLVGIPA